jgi:hypothetical protein
MRAAIITLLGAVFVTGCIFPSFDNMQNGKGSEPATVTETPEQVERRAETNATEIVTTGDASPDAAVVVAAQPDASVDATPDAAKSPGAGKIACGPGPCPVVGNSHCCSGYGGGDYCSMPGSTIEWCTGGGGTVLFCDERDDCPDGQVCCLKSKVASCATSCAGGQIK